MMDLTHATRDRTPPVGELVPMIAPRACVADLVAAFLVGSISKNGSVNVGIFSAPANQLTASLSTLTFDIVALYAESYDTAQRQLREEIKADVQGFGYGRWLKFMSPELR